jgi:hypothetical protein
MRARALAASLMGLCILHVSATMWVAHGSDLPCTPSEEPPPAEANEAAVGKSVRQLVEQLRRHPPKPAKAVDHLDLYMIDLELLLRPFHHLWMRVPACRQPRLMIESN